MHDPCGADARSAGLLRLAARFAGSLQEISRSNPVYGRLCSFRRVTSRRARKLRSSCTVAARFCSFRTVVAHFARSDRAKRVLSSSISVRSEISVQFELCGAFEGCHVRGEEGKGQHNKRGAYGRAGQGADSTARRASSSAIRRQRGRPGCGYGTVLTSRAAGEARESGLAKKRERPQARAELAAFSFSGADDRIRTGDLRFTRALLYQLSHVGACVRYVKRKAKLYRTHA